jgi:hypothetical protein
MPALALEILKLIGAGIAMTPTIVAGVKSIAVFMSSGTPPTVADWQAMDAALLDANKQIQSQVEGQQPTAVPVA